MAPQQVQWPTGEGVTVARDGLAEALEDLNGAALTPDDPELELSDLAEPELDSAFDPELDADLDHGKTNPELEVASASADLGEQRRADLQLRLDAYLTKGRARVLLTDNGHTMLSVKHSKDTWTLRVHHMFAAAPPAVVRAMARYCEFNCPESARVLRAYVDAQDHLVRPGRARREVTLDTQGRHHDLRAIFDGLNAHYFDGQVQAKITWGPRTKRRRGRESIKLGSYTIEDGLIRIHPVLDAANVPSFFVAYIVYHEMLHELHEMPIVDGRRIYHTAAFRRDEARFEAYAEALEWERLHVNWLLDR